MSLVTGLPDLELNQLFDDLWRIIYNFERRFSRFLPKSELTNFNRVTGVKVPITPEFNDLLTRASYWGAKTKGLFNPFIMPALQRVGYKKSAVSGYENDRPIDYTRRHVVGAERLIIGDNWAQIPYGTAIDFGGIGKGYLADLLGRELGGRDVKGYWLSLSGDIVTRGRDENDQPIVVAVQNADQPEGPSDWMVECPDEYHAVATSGTFGHHGQSRGDGWHHIIDPTTQKSAVTDVRLATVCADSAEQADVLASCAIILGSNKALPYLKDQGVKAALLQCVDADGKSFTVGFGATIHHINQAEVDNA